MNCRRIFLVGWTLALLLGLSGLRLGVAQQPGTPSPPDVPANDSKTPKVDEDLLPARSADGETNPLGPAKERPGDAGGTTGSPGVPFILPADRLPIAPSARGLERGG